MTARAPPVTVELPSVDVRRRTSTAPPITVELPNIAAQRRRPLSELGNTACNLLHRVALRRCPPLAAGADQRRPPWILAAPDNMDLVCARYPPWISSCALPPWISSAPPAVGPCSASRRELVVVGPLLAMDLVDGCRLHERSSFSFPLEGHPNNFWYCVCSSFHLANSEDIQTTEMESLSNTISSCN